MGAADLLQRVRAVGFRLDVDGDKLLVSPASKLSDELRAELRAAKPELLALLRHYRLSQAESDAAHAEHWADAACGRFAARVSLFMWRGINAADADDLAERLHLRDVHADDRRLCLECMHMAGRAATGWHCGNARAAGVACDLPTELVFMLQRCPGYGS